MTHHYTDVDGIVVLYDFKAYLQVISSQKMLNFCKTNDHLRFSHDCPVNLQM